MATTLTAARFGQLLAIDPSFIAAFIVGSNPDAVADKLAVLGFNRPTNVEGIETGLQELLDQQRGEQFVQALSVPLSLEHLSVEHASAAFSAVPPGTTEVTLGEALARQALRLYNEDKPVDESTTVNDIVDAVIPSTSTPEKRKKLFRFAILALAIVGALALVVALIQLIRTKS